MLVVLMEIYCNKVNIKDMAFEKWFPAMYPDVAAILDCTQRSKSSTLNTLCGLKMQLQVGHWKEVISNVPHMAEMCVW